MEENILKKIFLYSEKHIYFPVILLFLIVEILVNPIGGFCLNDDWAYAQAVNNYVTTSELKFSFWQAIPGLPLIFTGIFFSKLFGFSFTLLRLISVGCVIIMICVVDSNLKRFEVRAINRWMVLLLFVFNPLTISLGNSFMPDVFQLLLGVLTFHFMVLYFGGKRIFHLILFIIFALLLTLNRQTGIVIPIVFAILFFIREKLNVKNIGLGILPLVIAWLGLWIFEYVASAKQILPQNYNLQLNNIISTLSHPNLNNLKTISYYFITSSVCLGLFILPLTILGWKECYSAMKNSISSKIVFLIYISLVIFKIVLSRQVFPFVGNMFYHLGVGPVILSGFNTDENVVLSVFSKWAWILLNIIGGVSFFISISLILNRSFTSVSGNKNYVTLFFALLLFFYLTPLCFSYANDRYLLFLIPFYFIAYMLAVSQKINKLYFTLIFIPIFYFSVAGTHDYLSINRARMKATDYLMAVKKISPDKMDGGFEFNGWHSKNTEHYIPSHKGRWWFIDKDDYIVSPVKQKGYLVDSSFVFSSWMSFDFNEILVLKKEGE